MSRRTYQLHLYASAAEIVAQPLALPMSLERSSRDLTESLLGLALRTLSIRAGRGVRRTIESLVSLAQTAPGRHEYLVECSVGYVAQGAEIGVHSARAGLGMVLDLIGRATLEPSRAREAGYPIRDVKCNRWRGPLRLLTVESVEALRTVSDWLRENDLAIGAPVRTWQALPEEDLRTRGYRPLGCETRKGWVVCPLHVEAEPSLRLFDLGGSRGSRGAGYCHGCTRRVSWTRSETGAVFVREARGARCEASTSEAVRARGPSVRSRGSAQTDFLSASPRAVVSLSPGSTIPVETYERHAGSPEGYVVADRNAEGMRRRWSRTLLHALCWSDRSGPVAEQEAWLASGRSASLNLDSRALLPDRYLSASPLRATRFALRPLRRAKSGALAVPIAFEPGRQEWILVDIDDLDPALGWNAARFLAAVARRATADDRLSGRVALVTTSHSGLQVWAQLQSPEPSSRLWWSREDVCEWYDSISSKMLEDARRLGRSGGYIDRSAAAAGRYGRRPGWRLLDGFEPFRVCVEGVVLEPGSAPVSAAEARRYWRRTVRV